MEDFVVGIIGLGDMGKMYARRLSDAGWRYDWFQSSSLRVCNFQGKLLFSYSAMLIYYNDDLSAFGSTYCLQQTPSPFWHGARGWLSLMKNLSYLTFLRLKSYLPRSWLVSMTVIGIQMLIYCHRSTYLAAFNLTFGRDWYDTMGNRINACDKEEKYDGLRVEFANRVNTSLCT